MAITQATLYYIETCLPDYHRGFDGHVYAVPLSAKPRISEVARGLIHAIGAEELWFDGEYVLESVYADLRRQAGVWFRAFGNQAGAWDKGSDLSESYAYFGVRANQ